MKLAFIIFSGLIISSPLIATQYATLDDGSRIIIDTQSKTWKFLSKNKNIKHPEEAVNGKVILGYNGNKKVIALNPNSTVYLWLRYSNNTNEKIIGIRSRIVIKDIFGNIFLNREIEKVEDLNPSADFKDFAAIAVQYYGQEKEEFMKLVFPAISGRYIAEVTPTLVIFENGQRLTTTNNSLEEIKLRD